MEKVVPPKYVMHILTSLRARGHLAYLVGGCVRDMLLNVRPQDWDICTSALPEQVAELFPGSLPTGMKHGTVTVRVGQRQAEVTTFRSEGGYSDHRHPDAVSFVGDLREDLSRRDFTINAMALSPEGLLMDPFGGAQDLQRGLIRCVGEPERRFEEDALRMFRALRFAARLGFQVEERTMSALGACAPLAAGLAAERVRSETEKLLLTGDPASAWLLFDLGLMARYAKRPIGGRESFAPLERLPRRRDERWAGLCFILLRQGSISSAKDFLTALRLDSHTVRCCSQADGLLLGPPPGTPAEWKRLLRRWGVESVTVAAACADAVFGGRFTPELKAVLRSGECFSLKRLAVNGDDLMAIGLEGQRLGDALELLLSQVIERPEQNDRRVLLAMAEDIKKSGDLRDGRMGKA